MRTRDGSPTLKALVIDDNRVIQRLIAALLKDLGHEAVGFGHDGEEGYSLFKELNPDLVFLDLTMPNMDGKECLTAVLQHNPGAKVIICSALRSNEIVDECLRLGAIGFIEKDKLSVSGYFKNAVSDTLVRMQVAA